MGYVHVKGFDPVYDNDSKVLILGSIPSIKSRELGFYYGNKTNRFWRMLAAVFGSQLPSDVEGKKAQLLSRGVALWDVVTECDIDASKDSSIKNPKIIDVKQITEHSKVEKILLNGSKAYTLFTRRYPELSGMAVKMPSTSSANFRYDENMWYKELKPWIR